MTYKKIFAICGSTRTNSVNLSFIKAIRNILVGKFEVEIYENLVQIPHFNPDIDNDHPPLQVVDFRDRIRASEGVLICTPEYAMGVPGTLKNAIDWTVSSMEFSKKPVALITASSMGQKGHASLLETLLIIESMVPPETQLIIPTPKTKINSEAVITDEYTLKAVKELIQAFEELISDGKPDSV